MLGDYEIKRFNVWPISEWLINYQAGFVRRGLFGEILHRLHLLNGVIPLLNKLVLGFFYAYITIFTYVYLRSRVKSTAVFVIALLMPGGIFHMAIGAIFFTRKEILFLIHFGILCVFYLNLADKNLLSKWIFGLHAIIGGTFLTLIHEPYMFMAFPITILLMAIAVIENKNSILLKWLIGIYALLIPFVFIICSVHHGDPKIAQTIWDSYALADRLTLAPYAPYTSSFATGGLGWTLMQHLSTIYGVFISGTWVYWIFFILMNGWLLGWIVFQIQNKFEQEKSNENKKQNINSSYFIVVMFSYVISLSMLLIASDYGRWIACASNLSLLFAFAIKDSLIFKNRTTFFQRLILILVESKLKINKTSYTFLILLAYVLIFQMPECCIQTPDIFIRYDKFINLFL